MDVQIIQKLLPKLKIGENILCGYLMSIIWAFDHIEKKHTLDREKNFMKEFDESLREHARNINDF